MEAWDASGRGVLEVIVRDSVGAKDFAYAPLCETQGAGFQRERHGGSEKLSRIRPEIARLGALVGRWRSEGHVVGSPPEPITGTDTYEWLPGGFFIVHHVDVRVGRHTVQAIEIIGERDPATDAFIARAYDNEGNVTIMRATVDAEDVWTFTGGGDIAPAAQPASAKATGVVRSTLTVSAYGQRMSARWERSDDGAVWEPWMDMTFTRLP